MWSVTPGAVPGDGVRKAFKVAQAEAAPAAVYLAVPEDVEAMGAPQRARSLLASTSPA